MTPRKCGWLLNERVPYCMKDQDLDNCGLQCPRYSPGITVGEAMQGGDTEMTVHVRGTGVKKLREAAGMTMQEFGDLMEVTKSTVSRWEKDFMGMTDDHYETLQGISGIYEVDLEKLSG